LDLAKSFGENIRIRADLDFSPHRVNAGGGQVEIEQGYCDRQHPGWQRHRVLDGPFQLGHRSGSDRSQRARPRSRSRPVHRTLLPHNITGMRFGYDFSEATRLEAYVVNNLER
jgi:hypothetical protein